MSSSAHRGRILHFLGDPAKLGDKAWEYFEDGLLWIEHGHVRALDHATYLLPQLPADLPLEEHPQRLLLPGFVDCHVHYPQLGVIASYGTQLLDWLETHTFPAEQRFADAGYAAAQAELFLDELLRHGTTTALVFGTVHAVSAEAFFQAAQKRRLRMIAGKVLMDRNAPPALCDTAASGYAESRALIERWHGNGRLQYAVTPRFAPTSSPEQLAAAARLLDEYPGVYLHTHLSENLKEVAWVGELFPQAQDYLDVYHRAGLVGERSVFAHGIHLSERECRCLAHKNAALAHCPSSNLFIGSGLFDLAAPSNTASASASVATSAAAPACRCWPTSPTPTRSSNCAAPASIRSRRSTWPPSAAPGRSTWTAWSVTSCPAAKPTSSPSTWPPRR